MEKITYASVGGPPDNWQDFEVVDLDTNESIPAVECNSAEGWAVVHVEPLVIVNDMPATQRITGRFEIREREDTQR